MKVKNNIKKDIRNILILIPTTIIVALGLWVFVYKADFAPSGVDGLATVLQYLTGINAGFLAGVLNGACYLGSAIATYALGAMADKGGWTYALIFLIIITSLSAIFALIYLIYERIYKTRIVETSEI